MKPKASGCRTQMKQLVVMVDPSDPNTITEWYCCQCGEYHGKPPSRYDCKRCTHGLCPYCPRKRVGDEKQRES
ncbi:hypothetical protein CJU90_3310 [Yarrowia sp. C11]|nr:hypothetical protein CKK34_4756 [Yarrowia sp. E02]KAG5369782.1 hypothetical protein CJU90_3310 [Yarrowia sp. C11]